MSEGTGIENTLRIELRIADLRLQLANAERDKERQRHRKLQYDISLFFEIYGKSGNSVLTSNELVELFDKIREGLVSQ